MAYTKTVWVNNQAPAINAENLNKIEDGIYDSVRYADAQTLTDEQKTQARANIAAAPDGYGLGYTYGGEIPNSDFNQAIANGWYGISSSDTSAYINGPAGVFIGGALLFVLSRRSDLVKHQYLFLGTAGQQGQILRRYYSNTQKAWSEWEYINPPLVLGYEYRTTERYLYKPVYVKLVDFGALPNNTAKGVAIASNIDNVISIEVIVYSPESLKGTYFTGASGITNVSAVPNNSNVWIDTDQDLSATSVYCLCKYTKTTN